jgi:gamma-glutamyltranspeptidase/glutathione hydrolase
VRSVLEQTRELTTRHIDLGRLQLDAQTSTVDELRKRGHTVEVGPDWNLGRVSAVSKWNGIIRAGANPRGQQGYAVGR